MFTGRFHKPGVPVEVLFDRICRENGITHRLTKIHSPTTTGKIERLHQTLQRELLDVHDPFETVEALQAALDAWRQEYNTARPHQSLGMGFPASRFMSASSQLDLRVPAQLTGATDPPKPRPVTEPLPAQDPAAEPVTDAGAGCRAGRWTGWYPRQGTCGSAVSKSGSVPPCRGGRSPSGSTRRPCT